MRTFTGPSQPPPPHPVPHNATRGNGTGRKAPRNPRPPCSLTVLCTAPARREDTNQSLGLSQTYGSAVRGVRAGEGCSPSPQSHGLFFDFLALRVRRASVPLILTRRKRRSRGPARSCSLLPPFRLTTGERAPGWRAVPLSWAAPGDSHLINANAHGGISLRTAGRPTQVGNRRQPGDALGETPGLSTEAI